MVLSSREKLLILLLAVLAVGAIVYYALSSLVDYEDKLSRNILRREATLTKAKVLKASLTGANGRSTRAGTLRGSLIGHIEQLAARNALKDRIRLNRVPVDKSRGVQAVDIKLDQLSLDETVGFIHAIEHSRPVLVVDQMEITSSFRSKQLLRLSLRVLAQK
jgi:hypothetical protein